VRVVIFGGTGMVGMGALLECLEDARVSSVLVVGRRSVGIQHPNLEEIIHQDFFHYDAIQPRFADCDACFFCLGVSSVGMDADTYHHLTYDLTMAAAQAMLAANPQMTFCCVSGEGTDSSERGRLMWARVKGKTENDLLALFATAYMFRPGYIHPMRGAGPRQRWLRVVATVLRPVGFLLTQFPGVGTRTDVLGRAMLAAARSGAPSHVVEMREINTLGAARPSGA
jgi:uncharacterized protein YbjT (DUF2867 family)